MRRVLLMAVLLLGIVIAASCNLLNGGNNNKDDKNSNTGNMFLFMAFPKDSQTKPTAITAGLEKANVFLLGDENKIVSKASFNILNNKAEGRLTNIPPGSDYSINVNAIDKNDRISYVFYATGYSITAHEETTVTIPDTSFKKMQSVSGVVKGTNNVLVTLEGGWFAQEQSIGSDGSYEFIVPPGGPYTITPLKDGWGFVPAQITIPVVDTTMVMRDITATQSFHTITVKVNGADSVMVYISGDAVDSALVVNDGGSFSRKLPKGGTYSITAEKERYIFDSIYIENLDSGQSHEMNALPLAEGFHSIKGMVTGTDSVKIILGGDADSTLTVNNNETYTFIVPRAGSFTITPQKAGFEFDPPTRSYDTLVENINEQNFLATEKQVVLYELTISIAGADSVNVDITGDITHSLTMNGGETKILQVEEGSTFLVTPTKESTLFTPSSQLFESISGNVGVSFSASPEKVRLFGTVYGPAGVKVMLTGDIRDSLYTEVADGVYEFIVPGGGNYTITPVLDKHVFTPAFIEYSTVNNDMQRDFTAELNTVTISGTVSGTDSVTVELTGDLQASDMVVFSGDSYSFTVNAGGSYTITPQKLYYTFTPSSSAFNTITADQIADFTAVRDTVSIYGTVTGTDSAMVYLSGDGADSQMVTVSGGSYSFAVNKGASYMVSVQKDGYTFTPVSKSFPNILSSSAVHFNVDIPDNPTPPQ